MFGIGAPSVESKVAAANNVEELVQEMHRYARRLQKDKRLPADCRGVEVASGADLFNWWIEFDRMAAERSDPAGVLYECREVFGLAWERAATLGYKLQRVSVR